MVIKPSPIPSFIALAYTRKLSLSCWPNHQLLTGSPQLPLISINGLGLFTETSDQLFKTIVVNTISSFSAAPCETN